MVISRLRDPGFEIRDRDLKSGRDSETQNHPKTILRDQSQTLPRFRDWAKIFQTQVFRGTMHSITLLLGSSRVLRFYELKKFPHQQMGKYSLASFCWPKLRRLREDEEGTRAEDCTWRNKGWYDQNLLTCSLTPVSSSVRTRTFILFSWLKL